MARNSVVRSLKFIHIAGDLDIIKSNSELRHSKLLRMLSGIMRSSAVAISTRVRAYQVMARVSPLVDLMAK